MFAACGFVKCFACVLATVALNIQGLAMAWRECAGAGLAVAHRECACALLLFQSDGEIRYEACKDIVEGAELLVWYGDAYLQFMGIPICLKSSSSNQQAVALEQDSECDDYNCCCKSFF